MVFFLTEIRKDCCMQAASNQFVRRIHGNGRGWTFSQADFSDLAGRSNGDIALHRLHEAGKIRRILVATDFSEHSKRVVQYAFDLKRIFNSNKNRWNSLDLG